MSNINTFTESSYICKELKKKIVDSRIIHLQGEHGSGKTYISKLLYNEIIEWENWKTYYICGMAAETTPYSTFYNIFHANKFEISEINIPLPLPGVGFTLSRKNANPFNPEDYNIINTVLQSSEDDILIIADNFFSWDKQSKDLLTTMTLQQEIFSKANKRLHTIIVTDQLTDTALMDFQEIFHQCPTYETHRLDNVGLKSYLNNIISPDTNVEISNNFVDYINNLTGGDMNIIHTIIKNYNDIIRLTNNIDKLSTDEHLDTLNKLILYRIHRFTNHNKEISSNIESILSIAALFDHGFTAEELSYIVQQDEVHILQILVEAKKEGLIKELPPYIFSCMAIKNVLTRNMQGQEKIYYKKQYELLSDQKPQLYYQRAKYLSKAETCNVKVVYLSALAYSRYNSYDDNNLCNSIIMFTQNYANDNINSNEITEAYSLFCDFIEIVNCFHCGDFNSAYEKSLSFGRITDILLYCELQSIAVSSLVLINNSTASIRDVVENNLELLPILKEKGEFEQYVRMLLIHIPILIDKLNDVDGFNKLRKELTRALFEDKMNPFLSYAQATIQRKSNLYKSYDTAYTDTAQAISFFHKKNMIVDKYLSLCNHAGNLILANKYEQSIKCSQEAYKLLKYTPTLYSPQKVNNNLILGNLLKLENEYVTSKLSAYKFKEHISELIHQLIDNQMVTDDLDAELVIKINICSLYAYIGNFETSRIIISEIDERLLQTNNNDDFYPYFIANIKLGIAIIENEWEIAAQIINTLESIPSLFHKSKHLIEKRYIMLKEIVSNRESLSSIEYNFILINKLSRFSDASWHYFSRGFPISELQFYIP
ncbi:MAG: hypothetical protein ACK5MV_04315 [Aminipila sp.]